MPAYITVGATTTHGGEVISGSSHTTHNGIPISRKGDKVICKKCKKLTTILTGDSSFIIDGAPIARAGDVTSCGARLIAVQQSFCESNFEVILVEQPEPLQFNKSNLKEDNSEEITSTKIQLLNEKTQEPLIGLKYTLTFKDGSIEQGLTDSSGYTIGFKNSSKDIVNIEYPDFKGFGDLIKDYI